MQSGEHANTNILTTIFLIGVVCAVLVGPVTEHHLTYVNADRAIF